VANFVDRALLQLADPAGLQTLIAPGPGVPASALEMLVGSVYDLEHVRIDQITGVTVSDVHVQYPLYPVERHQGSWSHTQPSYVITDVAIDSRWRAEPTWVDLLARVRVETTAEVDLGGIESALTRGLADFDTLDDFRDQFRYIDLDDFMARHKLVTVDDLREAFDYLLTEVHLRTPGPFDPADPANVHDIEMDVAVLIRDGVDLAGLLRAAATVRTIAEQTRVGVKDALLGLPDCPLAVAAVLDRGAVTDAGLTPATVGRLLAREQILGLVADPP
jgi:hypothetical protein